MPQEHKEQSEGGDCLHEQFARAVCTYIYAYVFVSAVLGLYLWVRLQPAVTEESEHSRTLTSRLSATAQHFRLYDSISKKK